MGLINPGAADENRTHILSLGSSYSTIELQPQSSCPLLYHERPPEKILFPSKKRDRLKRSLSYLMTLLGSFS